VDGASRGNPGEAGFGVHVTAPDGSEAVWAHLAAALRATAAIAAAGGTAAAAIAARLPQPGRVLALRLADAQGPVPRLDVLPAPATSPHVLERARAFAARVNRASRVPVSP
jgi:3-hydroxyacyl-CoA dehydrogenase